MAKAPRLLARGWRGFARGAGLAAALVAGGAQAQSARIVAAEYAEPSDLYGHLVLGKDHNWAALRVRLAGGAVQVVRLSDRVFEDTAPRLVDVDLDGSPEILVVESHPEQGARVAIYGVSEGQVALWVATPFIGQVNRWYAPVGAADLDGDGAVEIAFVDRPHLAKTLRVWRYERTGAAHVLRSVAALEGVTNHRIGAPFIVGGIRACAGAPQMVLGRADWSGTVAVTLEQGALRRQDLPQPATGAGFARALACAD